VRGNLGRADLYGADLSRADLSRANLYGANLGRADLCGASLYGADLSRADLCGANLSRANLSRADLCGADLSRANLYGANLGGANLYGANLCGADLLCQGNMREIRTMQFDAWAIGYTADTLRIGCQHHPIEKWRKWSTDAGRAWIAKMDSAALAWADRNLALVLAMIDANPATPTGHEAKVEEVADRSATHATTPTTEDPEP
jgi:hypothetical protein